MGKREKKDKTKGRDKKRESRSRSRSSSKDKDSHGKEMRDKKVKYEASNKIDRDEKIGVRKFQNEIMDLVVSNVKEEERKQFENLDEDEQLAKVFGICEFDTTKVTIG
jgi:hypothetical protein